MNNKIKKVAIVYHYVAHYRKPIFELLCNAKNIDYYVVADEKSNMISLNVLDSSLESTGKSISVKWLKIKNFWITKDILWQSGLIKLAFGKFFDELIFLGNMYFITTWIAVILARLTGKRIYFWTHGFRNNENGIRGSIRLAFYRLADGLFLYGNRAKEILIKKGYAPEKLHVIYNSLDFDAQTEKLNQIQEKDKKIKRQSMGIFPEDKLIIATGRITKEKKFDLLLDSIKLLNAIDDTTYKLIIIGDGPDKDFLEKKGKNLSISEKIIFYGACYAEDEMALLISMSDVAVVPGDIGLSAIHSLTYGTPVVTHDDFTTHKPEFEAIKDGINGSFYRAGSIEDMVEKIRFWSLNKNRRYIFEQCRAGISIYYNASYQKSIIDKAITKGF